MIQTLGFVSLVHVFINVYEYAMHTFLHYNIIKPMYRWHHRHHIDYPPSRPTSDTYINTSGPLYTNVFLQMSIPPIIIMYFLLSRYNYCIFTIQSLSYLYTMNYLHIQYHLNSSWLDEYKWFRRNREYHILHHKKYRKNFNLLDHTTDKIKGTFTQ